MEQPSGNDPQIVREDNQNAFTDKGDHFVDDRLDSDPNLYKTVFVGGKEGIITVLKEGLGLSISVNMENYHIYIGSDHLSMQRTYNVPDGSLCAAYARIDRKTKKVVIEDFSDWRVGMTNAVAVKKAIAERLQQDIS